jgi:excisionase family DNA binding protein
MHNTLEIPRVSGEGDPKFLTVKQVAELLGFHPETIKRWAREGKIVYQQAGHYGHIRIKWPLEKPRRPTKNNKLLQAED